MTPSTTATSQPAEPCSEQRRDQLLADHERVEVAAEPAGGERVVARVDVVRADLERADPQPARRSAAIRPVATVVLPLPEAGAAMTTPRRDGYHSMPRWPFWPASIGCLTLVISVTRSAASSSLRGGSRGR